MTQKFIRKTFMQALSTYAASHTPVLTIAREGLAFTKPDGVFLEAFIVPANTTNPTVDGIRKRYWGEFQVNVWCREGKGTEEGETIAEEIAALFPLFPKNYLPVSVESTPSIKRAITDLSGWRVVPVCIPYRAEF